MPTVSNSFLSFWLNSLYIFSSSYSNDLNSVNAKAEVWFCSSVVKHLPRI